MKCPLGAEPTLEGETKGRGRRESKGNAGEAVALLCGGPLLVVVCRLPPRKNLKHQGLPPVSVTPVSAGFLGCGTFSARTGAASADGTSTWELPEPASTTSRSRERTLSSFPFHPTASRSRWAVERKSRTPSTCGRRPAAGTHSRQIGGPILSSLASSWPEPWPSPGSSAPSGKPGLASQSQENGSLADTGRGNWLTGTRRIG